MTRSGPSHESYAQVALQYYVAARFAALAGQIPVSGNLMHHAFEFILKAAVIHSGAVTGDAQTVGEFLKCRYGHRLSRIWKDFKKTAATDLSRFDTAVKSLDRWEEIRYPPSWPI